LEHKKQKAAFARPFSLEVESGTAFLPPRHYQNQINAGDLGQKSEYASGEAES
jgi:hypothetical protein